MKVRDTGTPFLGVVPQRGQKLVLPAIHSEYSEAAETIKV